MKKYMLMSFVIAFLLVTLAGPCLAGTVANTSKKGSLLIFPLIRTDFSGLESWETLITIGNDNYFAVEMQCVFVLQNGCNSDIQLDFQLTANQPITFRASDGYDLDGNDIVGGGIDKGQVAEAKCWVKRFVFDDEGSDNSTAISYNHLTGEATLLRTYNGAGVGAATYSAWRFAANAVLGTQMGAPGRLELSGTSGNYDSCPGALIFDLLKQVDNPTDEVYVNEVDNFVAIVPCKQDFTQDGGGGVVKLDITRRDENERSALGAFCLNCFIASSLANPPGGSVIPGFNTPAAAFTAKPFVPTTCPYGGGTECSLPSGYVAYPTVGVLIKKFEGFLGPITAATPTGVGEWTTNGNACKGAPAIDYRY